MSKGREDIGGGVQWARGQCGDRYGERLGRAGQDDGAGSHTYEVHPSVEYAVSRRPPSAKRPTEEGTILDGRS